MVRDHAARTNDVSAFGTERRCRSPSWMSAFGGKADIGRNERVEASTLGVCRPATAALALQVDCEGTAPPRRSPDWPSYRRRPTRNLGADLIGTLVAREFRVGRRR